MKIEIANISCKLLIKTEKMNWNFRFKEIVDVSREGLLAKIAKDIFTFVDYGGGFILIGFQEHKTMNHAHPN